MNDDVNHAQLTIEIHNSATSTLFKSVVKDISISYTIKTSWKLGHLEELPKTQILDNKTKKHLEVIINPEDLSKDFAAFEEFDTFESLPDYVKNYRMLLLPTPTTTISS